MRTGPPSCRRESIDSSVAADVRIDFGTWSIRACPRTNAISRALLFETPTVPRYYVRILRSCCFVHGPRYDGVGGIVVVDQQAHAARSRGFRRGSTWRVIHRVAGITLARWLQLVVAGPRGPTCRPSFSLVYATLSFPLLSSLWRVVPPLMIDLRAYRDALIDQHSPFREVAKRLQFPFSNGKLVFAGRKAERSSVETDARWTTIVMDSCGKYYKYYAMKLHTL